MKTNIEILAAFDEQFNIKYKQEVNGDYFVGNEKISEVKAFITTALNQRTEDIVGMINKAIEEEEAIPPEDELEETAEWYRISALTDITNKIKALYGVEKI